MKKYLVQDESNAWEGDSYNADNVVTLFEADSLAEAVDYANKNLENTEYISIECWNVESHSLIVEYTVEEAAENIPNELEAWEMDR